MLRLPRTVDAALARTLIPAHDPSRKARAIFLVALGLLASAVDLVLNFHLLCDVLEKHGLAPDALLAAVIQQAQLVLSLEAGTALPLALLVAFAGMVDIEIALLRLPLVQRIGQHIGRLLVGVGVVVMVADGSQPAQRLPLERLVFFQHLLVDVRFATTFKTHDPECKKPYSMKECFLDRDLRP